MSQKKNKIRELLTAEDISKVRSILIPELRNLLLFDILTQTGAKLKDALKLKVEDLAGLEIGTRLPTLFNGVNKPTLTKQIAETFTLYLRESQLLPKDFLFKSRKASMPLSLTSGSHLIRKWFRDAGVAGLEGARSLQKYYTASLENLRDAQSDDQGPKIHPSNSSAKSLKPVEVSTMQEIVYNQLFQAIILGHIPPGAPIVTGDIAKQMKVSSMPVRDALNRLQATGFLSRTNNRACIVNKLSASDLREITRIRLKLEPFAAKYAAVHIQNETIDVLRRIHEEYIRSIKKRDFDKFLGLNKEFHYTIYRESNMPILFEIIERLWGRASPYQYILWREGARADVEWSIRSHADIIDALYHNDSERVEEAIKNDLSISSKNLTPMLEKEWGKDR
jgi:DNA-binding GntR family transcriptional regulator